MQSGKQFIKFTFNGKCRKVANEVSGFADLVAQARNLFGEKVNDCVFLYEDVDNELINVTDDEDVKTLLAESLAFNKPNIKILVKPNEVCGETKPRSVSQKRKVLDNAAEFDKIPSTAEGTNKGKVDFEDLSDSEPRRRNQRSPSKKNKSKSKSKPNTVQEALQRKHLKQAEQLQKCDQKEKERLEKVERNFSQKLKKVENAKTEVELANLDKKPRDKTREKTASKSPLTEEKREFIKNKILEQMNEKKQQVLKKFEAARVQVQKKMENKMKKVQERFAKKL